MPIAEERAPERAGKRRLGKEVRERLVALVLLVAALPVFVVCIVAIKLEALLGSNAKGPVFFTEDRIAQGRVIKLLKFRTLTADALAELGPGPTHIGTLERAGRLTRVGRWLRTWYLDELPQLWNIVSGDMLFIGTRPYPIELYQEELDRGITRKRDMPAGLIGPVQASKGTSLDPVRLDAEYWEALQHESAWNLLKLDAGIVLRSIRVQLQHRGL